MPNALRIVLDTNVLYAGLYSRRGASHRILRGIEERWITPVLSTTLLFEYEDVLRREGRVLGLSKEEIDETLDGICLRGEARTVYFLWRPQLTDPKDDHILELAVASDTRTIVTHNTRHFGNADNFGVRAVTPKALLETLR